MRIGYGFGVSLGGTIICGVGEGTLVAGTLVGTGVFVKGGVLLGTCVTKRVGAGVEVKKTGDEKSGTLVKKLSIGVLLAKTGETVGAGLVKARCVKTCSGEICVQVAVMTAVAGNLSDWRGAKA
jgi:hypothetical protein